MENKHKPIITRVFYAFIIFEILFVVALAFQPHDHISFTNEPLYSLNDNWTYVDRTNTVQTVTLPAHLPAGNENSIAISRRLPEMMNNINSLSIHTTNQDIIVYLGDSIIYKRISYKNTYLLDVPHGAIWDIIPLPPKSEGELITIITHSEYKDHVGYISEINAGTKASILINTIDTYGFGFVMSVMIFVIGLFFVIIYYFVKKLYNPNRSLLYLGWFSFLAAIWMLMESNMTQLFFHNAYIIAPLSYLSLMALPLPILFYISLIEGFHYKKLNICLMYWIIMLNTVLIILQIFNIMDFYHSLRFVQINLFTVLTISFIVLCLELIKHKNKEIKSFTISAAVLLSFGAIEQYSYDQYDHVTGLYFQLGFIIFITILAWSSLKKFIDVVKLSETAKHYKLLATRDPLTNCRSRASYTKDFDRVDLSRNITIFMADMNNMKEVNDKYGHHAGDEVIILCSQCLLKAFGRRVYRIGGDEFVMIEYDLSDTEIQIIIEDFYNECKRSNEDSLYHFDMSIGYARFDRSVDKTIYDTVKRADKNMYDQKVKRKH